MKHLLQARFFCLKLVNSSYMDIHLRLYLRSQGHWHSHTLDMPLKVWHLYMCQTCALHRQSREVKGELTSAGTLPVPSLSREKVFFLLKHLRACIHAYVMTDALGVWQAYEKLRRIAADRFCWSLSPSWPFPFSAVQESCWAKTRKPSLNLSLTLWPLMCVHTNTHAAQRSRRASGGLLFCCHPPSLQHFPCALDQDLKGLKQLHQKVTRHVWHVSPTQTQLWSKDILLEWQTASSTHFNCLLFEWHASNDTRSLTHFTYIRSRTNHFTAIKPDPTVCTCTLRTNRCN